jgi:hypothetical protein
MDRIARHLPTFLEFMALLRHYDVKLISLREGIDYRKSWGKLVLYILGALAEFYSDNLSLEIRLKRLMDAKNGILAPTYRFGYCKGNCSTCTDPNGADYCHCFGGPDRRNGAFRIPHPIESHAVRLMFEWYATGHYSFADIARQLNEQVFSLPNGQEVRFRTKGRGEQTPPGPFDADAVRAIVSNPIYTGLVTYAGSSEDGKRFRKPREPFKGKHEALIDDLTFQRAQHIREGRFHRSNAQAQPAHPYPLSHVLVCACRHGTLRTSSTGSHRYSVDRLCQLKHGEQHQPNLKADPIETKVRETVGQITLPECWIRRILGYVLYDEGEDALVQDRLALHQRLEAATYLVHNGVISTTEYEQRRSRLLRALAALEPISNPSVHEALELLHNLPMLLQVFSDLELNLVYRSIFSAVVVQDQSIVAWEAYPLFINVHSQFSLPGTHSPTLGPYPQPSILNGKVSSNESG